MKGSTASRPAEPGGRSPWWPPAFLGRAFVSSLILFLIYVVPIIGLTIYVELIRHSNLRIFGLTYDLEYLYNIMLAYNYVGYLIFLKIFFVPLWLRIYLALGGRGHIFVDPDLDPDFKRTEDGQGYVKSSPGRIRYRDYVPTKDIPWPNGDNINKQKYEIQSRREKIAPWVSVGLFIPLVYIIWAILIIMISTTAELFEIIYPSYENRVRAMLGQYGWFFMYFVMFAPVIILLGGRIFIIVIYRLIGGTFDARWFFPIPEVRWYNFWYRWFYFVLYWLSAGIYSPPPKAPWYRGYNYWWVWYDTILSWLFPWGYKQPSGGNWRSIYRDETRPKQEPSEGD